MINEENELKVQRQSCKIRRAIPARSLVLLPVALMVVAAFVPGVFSKGRAAFQQAAKRVTGPAPKSSTPAKARPLPQSAESQIVSYGRSNSDGTIIPDMIVTGTPVERSMGDINADQLARPLALDVVRRHPEHEGPDREHLPSAPAIDAAQWPLPTNIKRPDVEPSAPQTLGTQFDGATGPNETGAFPPDTMGAVGPTQVFVFLNGRMRTFNKSTGVADGILNVNPDTFFASVESTPGGGEIVFTSDPQVRFDRLSNRWFVVIIDVILNASTGATTRVNRVLIAVSDAASSGNVTASTVWTFYQFTGDATLFTDYESLGIDASALYIGGNMFTLAGSFNSTKGFVIPKAPLLTGSAATVWSFPNLAAGSGAGPFAPRGVDNYDPNNTGITAAGYFIGVDNQSFSLLSLRRITNPGSLGPAPTMSANITINTTVSTSFPVLVPHSGNALGTNGRLDSLDDRLYAAHLRNNRLWTAHNIGVSNLGTTPGPNRCGARWYEIQNVSTTPTVLQVGTLFDNSAPNDATGRNYWIPSIMVSGQGHAALGCSIAGTNERVNAFTTGRLVGDTLGTLRDGPGVPAGYTASSTAYNPPSDPGGAGGRRWGDYSFTSLDPKDDMTMWTIQEYCNGTNTYGVRAVKLIAPPPPPTNTPVPAAIPLNTASNTIAVTGTAPAGQGFYDPGADPPSPHTPFTHITASGSGIIVNSITYTDATHVTLNVSTVGSTSGSKTVTITNPDGQTTSVSILVGPTEAKVDSFTATGFNTGQVLLQWNSGREVNNIGYNVYREVAGKKTKITPQPIAGSALTVGNGVGLQAGNSYAWSDQPSTSVARYWLESIDLAGKSEAVGPVTIQPSRGKGVVNTEQSKLLSKLGMAQAQLNLQGSAPVERRAELAAASPAEVQQQNLLASQPAVKISVKQEGWYRVAQRDLVAAGLDSRTDPRKLQMYVGGRQVPMIVNGEQDGRFDLGDSIEFYGMGLDSTPSDIRVYWLTGGTGGALRIKSVRPSGTPGATSFQYAVERKDRTVYFASLRNGETENFFGPVINSAGIDQSLTLSKLASSAPSSASLSVSAQGVTLGLHQLKVQLNGSDVGTLSFSDQESGKASFTISQSRLREGENVVRLTSQAGGGDISLVDTVRIAYWHSYAADSNQLSFSANPGQEVSITGFATNDVRVMDVTDPFAPAEYVGAITGGKGAFTMKVAVQGSGQRSLIAFTPDRARQVASVARNTPSSWKQEGRTADMIVITRADLLGSAAPLASFRAAQGLSVAVVDVEDLYDEFNFGNKSPQALRDFLTFTRQKWLNAPRFVLLLGDGSYDPKNYLGYGDADLVPTKLIDTVYMEAASDDWFVDQDGDGLTDIAVGRIPARNAGEAAAMISRIINYENSAAPNSALLASDIRDGVDFAAESSELKALLPANITVTEIARGSGADDAVKAQLLAGINQGQKLVNYVGHGSINLWRGGLLMNQDALQLTNGSKLSVFVLMTCLNGYFDDPALESLGESLLRAPAGGAVSVWASTAMCDPGGQTTLNQEFYRLLFNGQNLSIGQAAMRAKAAVSDIDVRRSWILLGDPAGRIK